MARTVEPSTEAAAAQAEPHQGYAEHAGHAGMDEDVIARGVKIAGEALLVPGTSLFLDGKIVDGTAHVLFGLLAKWALGPIGWIVVAADSYSRSVTGKHLTGHLGRDNIKRELTA